MRCQTWKPSKSQKGKPLSFSFQRHQVGSQIMDIVVLERPQRVQVRLQWVLDYDLRRITVANVTVIISIGIDQRNDEVVDLIQRALHRLSVTEGDGYGFVRR